VTTLRAKKWQLLPLLAILAAGCDLPGKPQRPEPADKAAQFNALYASRCAGCHGADGKLGPAPPLNDPLFLAIASDADLSRVIAEGRVVTPGQRSLMPAFARDKGGPLTGAEVGALAEGIKVRWGPAASSPPGLTETGPCCGDKDRGVRVFARACAGCHGNEGEGVEHEGRLRRKIHDPAFLALISDQALRRYVITGRPDLGMPACDGKDGRPPDFQPLAAAEIDDVAALLAGWRQGESTPKSGRKE
jgi:mono/diheme cytochrome c family protein